MSVYDNLLWVGLIQSYNTLYSQFLPKPYPDHVSALSIYTHCHVHLRARDCLPYYSCSALWSFWTGRLFMIRHLSFCCRRLSALVWGQYKYDWSFLKSVISLYSLYAGYLMLNVSTKLMFFFFVKLVLTSDFFILLINRRH